MKTNDNKVGLDALLTPENSVLILIDHQPFQFANLRNMDPTLVLNNTIGLAKGAKAFKVPTILTTVTKDRGGNLPQALQAIFPDQVTGESHGGRKGAMIDFLQNETWRVRRLRDGCLA